jgi:hypothetical protein
MVRYYIIDNNWEITSFSTNTPFNSPIRVTIIILNRILLRTHLGIRKMNNIFQFTTIIKVTLLRVIVFGTKKKRNDDDLNIVLRLYNDLCVSEDWLVNTHALSSGKRSLSAHSFKPTMVYKKYDNIQSHNNI